MNVDDLFSSKYLKAEDLKSKPRTVVIDSAEELQFRERKRARTKDRPDISAYEGGNNSQSNQYICHSRRVWFQTENWIGREIILYPDMTFMGEQRVPCIRVRIPESK